MRDMVLVLNFDDAASRAVTRKLRAERVLCKIVPGTISLEEIQAQSPLGLLLAGRVTGERVENADARIYQAGIPLLALGDAATALLSALGGMPGEVALKNAMANLEYTPCPLMQGVENGERLMQCARAYQMTDQLKPICRAPSARKASSALTPLSSPPVMAHTAVPSPTTRPISSTARATKASSSHQVVQPQMSWAKFRSMRQPSGSFCSTSNCTA